MAGSFPAGMSAAEAWAAGIPLVPFPPLLMPPLPSEGSLSCLLTFSLFLSGSSMVTCTNTRDDAYSTKPNT